MGFSSADAPEPVYEMLQAIKLRQNNGTGSTVAHCNKERFINPFVSSKNLWEYHKKLNETFGIEFKPSLSENLSHCESQVLFDLSEDSDRN
jgi:hypothetical protein